MARPLTQKSIDAIKPGANRRETPDGRIPGLYFITQSSGKQSWALRYRYAGKTRKHTVGTYPAIGLAAARRLASDAHALLAKDEDPSEARRKSKAALSDEVNRVEALMPQVVDVYLKRAAEPHNRSAPETRRQFEKRVLPHWKAKRVGEVSRADVLLLLDKIVDEGAGITANRVLAAVRRFFNWAVERGLIDDSPCKGIKPPAPELSRDRVLSDREIHWLWHATHNLEYPFGPMIRLLLLTGQRRSEVAGMRWNELDVDGHIWTIPGDRAKNGKAHSVPLTEAVLGEIEALPKIGETPGYVFTVTGKTPSSGFSRAKRRIDSELLAIAQAETTDCEDAPSVIDIPDWRLHDLRRTAASGMARLGQPVHVVEAVLNHKSGSVRGVAAVYNRYDYASEKSEALTAWSRLVLQLAECTTAEDVSAKR